MAGLGDYEKFGTVDECREQIHRLAEAAEDEDVHPALEALCSAELFPRGLCGSPWRTRGGPQSISAIFIMTTPLSSGSGQISYPRRFRLRNKSPARCANDRDKERLAVSDAWTK